MWVFKKKDDRWPAARRLAQIAKTARKIGGQGADLVGECPLPGTIFTYEAPCGLIRVRALDFPYLGKPYKTVPDTWLVPVSYLSSDYETRMFVEDIVRNYKHHRVEETNGQVA